MKTLLSVIAAGIVSISLKLY